MKKRFLSVLLVLTLMSSMMAAYAAEPRFSHYVPVLSFSGTTANCSVSITAVGKPITATLELWQGNTRLTSWSGSATSYLTIDKTYSVTAGRTYTLKLSGTIGGEPFDSTSTTAAC